MVEINNKRYFTSLELARHVGVAKTYICRLANEGRLRHERTVLGYLFPEEVMEDWDRIPRKKRKQ